MDHTANQHFPKCRSSGSGGRTAQAEARQQLWRELACAFCAHKRAHTMIRFTCLGLVRLEPNQPSKMVSM